MGARRLPVVPRPYRDELLSSWIGRVACRYGLDAGRLTGVLVAGGEGGAPPILADDIAPAADQMELLAQVCGVDPARLRRLSLAWRHPERSRAWFSSQGPPWAPTALRSPPVCSGCFDTDRAEGRDHYLRADWMLAERCVCPAHRQLLRDRCPFCRHRLQLQFRLRELRGRLVCSQCEQELGAPRGEGGETLDGATVEVLLALQKQVAAIVRGASQRRARLETDMATLWAPLDDPGAARPALALWFDETGWRCPAEVQHAIGASFPLGRLPIGWRVVTLIAYHALFEVWDGAADGSPAAHLARRAAISGPRPGDKLRRPTSAGSKTKRPCLDYLGLAREILAHPDWIAAACLPERRRNRVLARLMEETLARSSPLGLNKALSAHRARTPSAEQAQDPKPRKAIYPLSGQ